MRVMGVALGFVLLYGVGAVLGWVVLPVVRLLTQDRVRGQHRCQRIVARALGVMVWYITSVGLYSTGIFTSTGKAKDEMDVAPGSVVIANHPSLLDVVLLKAALGRGVIVVKPAYYFHPLLGLLAWCCGYIRGGSSLARGMQVIREAVSRIAEGSTIIIFPEGTRSPADGLRSFHRGAFRIAEEAGAPLAPFWIGCRPRVLGKGQGLRGYPNHRVKLDAFELWDDSHILVTNARASASEWEQRYNSIRSAGGMERCT